jgi:hypothetical protein
MKKLVDLSYRLGDNLDFYLQNKNQAVWGIVMEQIRDDLGGRTTDEECEAELRRLCEPSVRHYTDCLCAICR